MSDCSMNAMKPKEPPKTCGTCYWMMMQPGHGECGACGNPECGLERLPEAYGNGYYQYTTVDGDCECAFWTPRTDDLEQRCQQLERKYEMAFKAMVECEEQHYQLEQVARDMWRYMNGVLNHNFAYTLPTDTDNFRNRLEELGVSVDD